jgi:hypothetical protein
MTSRASKTVRAGAKGAAKDLKALIKGVGAAAREVAKKHGATKSVTIVKGQTISKDQPTRIKIVRKD